MGPYVDELFSEFEFDTILVQGSRKSKFWSENPSFKSENPSFRSENPNFGSENPSYNFFLFHIRIGHGGVV